MAGLNKLTETKLKSAALKKPGKYSDGGAMYLFVTPNLSRSFRADYSLVIQQTEGNAIKKRKTIVLGSVDDHKRITLEEARGLRDAAVKLAAKGIDPVAYRNRVGHLNAESGDGRSFKFHSAEWLEKRKSETDPKYYKTLKFRVEEYIDPVLGDMNLADITPFTIRDLVIGAKLAAGEYDISRRLVKMVKAIFDRARSFDRFAGLNPAEPLLADMPKTPKSEHYPAITTPKELAELLVDLDNRPGDPTLTGCAKLSLLTGLRGAEIRFLTWSEVRFEEGILFFEVGRMKDKTRAHKVPLSSQAIEILRFLESLNRHKSEFVFYARRNDEKVVTEDGLNNAFKYCGGGRKVAKWKGKHTHHGCRKTFRTLAADECKIPEDQLEHSLHHLTKWPNGTAYAVNDKLEERFDAMQIWADYLDELRRKFLAGEPILTRAEIAYKKRREEAAA